MKRDLLLQQTINGYAWVNNLLQSVPYKKWEQTPPVIESNVMWQAGHLLVSFYYNSILVIKGHQPEILSTITLELYSKLFTQAAAANCTGKITPLQLHNDLKFVQQKSIEVITKLKNAELDADLEPCDYPHPIAKTKFEALEWNINHTFWHCGQLALLKRVIDERYDFGLKQKSPA